MALFTAIGLTRPFQAHLGPIPGLIAALAASTVVVFVEDIWHNRAAEGESQR